MGTPAIPPQLLRANQWMANGEYENAASAYKELARRAEELFPQRAPFLYIEAGRAAILNGQTKPELPICGADSPSSLHKAETIVCRQSVNI
ncbi:MAG: hypothetical protein IPL71_05625 [Anaerolineales bacterium]|uniref:hypothetical protein n=1 Tax=Candidatus Villigracilis proximus TaxID=3140683 RepID=UPI00313670F6|nr:hypothetical protein [Anaerolineales bacterium]